MSWFSREWNGTHLEGCAYFCECGTTDLPMDIPCGPCIRSETPEAEGNCTCPELMTERAVGAAEMQRDVIKEHGQ